MATSPINGYIFQVLIPGTLEIPITITIPMPGPFSQKHKDLMGYLHDEILSILKQELPKKYQLPELTQTTITYLLRAVYGELPEIRLWVFRGKGQARDLTQHLLDKAHQLEI